ncbi:unnamed protein product [Paramecium primaurelia]|uniref:Uncharacterized protein n=2 Tax=Paramecium TaxID=5884 RepID=A0A8S1XA91_9CILI|nr:unnamed protein product [Paramecium primaurelia]CAD8197782.1 unnamed protein product [Paramecium pentaurelia]
MNSEYFWPQYKVKPIISGGCVSNQNEQLQKFKINITNPMLDSITSINSDIEEPLKQILLQAGLQQQDLKNPSYNSLFRYLSQEPLKNTTKLIANKQQRKTQPQVPSRHSTIMPKKSIVVSQFNFQHNNQNAQNKPPPKLLSRFPALDLIEQIQTLNLKQIEQQQGQEDDVEPKFALNLVTNERNLDYSFSSQSDEQDNDKLDS